MNVNFIKKSIEKLIINYRERALRLQNRGLLYCVKNNRGYVLVIVLLVTAMMVSVTSEFLVNAQTNVHYVRKFRDRLSAAYYAKTALNIATAVLQIDRRGGASAILPGINGNSKIDSYHDLWALELPEMPLEEGTISFKIEDENAKINLSVLANEFVDKSPYYVITQRFFINLGLSPDHADSLIDWVDIDDSRFPYGAESSDYYMNLDSPYTSRNGEMISIQEMLLVKGITPEIFYGLGTSQDTDDMTVEHNRGTLRLDEESLAGNGGIRTGSIRLKRKNSISEIPIRKEKSRRLSDYFRVHGDRSDYLGELNRININTASYRVLQSLTDDMTDDRVTEIIRRRLEKPFQSVHEVNTIIEDETVRNNLLTVRSSIFRIRAIGKIHSTTVTILAIYNRETKSFLYMAQY